MTNRLEWVLHPHGFWELWDTWHMTVIRTCDGLNAPSMGTPTMPDNWYHTQTVSAPATEWTTAVVASAISDVTSFDPCKMGTCTYTSEMTGKVLDKIGKKV